jgi:two-component system response regulator NreC
MIRVVLADDHETVREGLRLLIDAQPDMTVVGEAGDGQAAVEQTRRLVPDVLVLDLTMPGMGGLDATRALTNTSSRTQIVVLTRHAEQAYVDELRAAGAAAYVLKQRPSAQLLQAIRAVVAGGSRFHRAVRNENPRQPASTLPAVVTPREREVLRLAAIGQSNKDIADTLSISARTVEVHKTNAMRKLGFHGRADLVQYAIVQGWLRDP